MSLLTKPRHLRSIPAGLYSQAGTFACLIVAPCACSDESLTTINLGMRDVSSFYCLESRCPLCRRGGVHGCSPGPSGAGQPADGGISEREGILVRAGLSRAEDGERG